MDRYNEGAYAQTDGNTNATYKSRRSTEGREPQTPRLQKKKSNAGVRSASQPQRNALSYTPQESVPDTRGTQEGLKGPRKGSLRNAIRKVFGRRSREAEPASQQLSPPRHGYHRSEPIGTLPTQPEEPERSQLEPRTSQRNFSVPLDLPPAGPAFPRTRSPYAVEFPRSARLKPLNLGNPFNAPGSQLRRRKTLPSVLVTGEDAATIKASIESADEPATAETGGDVLTSQIGRAISTRGSTRGSDKRRSRSETDLRAGLSERPKVPQRKRSDEIRYWRESYQPNVLRASGFRVSTIPSAGAVEGGDEEKTPMPRGEDDPFEIKDTAESSPRGQRGLNVSNVDDYSFSALGTELSRDLEDRVARLETGLRNFQASLEKLNAEQRSRRTVVAANTPEPGSKPVSGKRGRASSRDRTASILAGDLQGDLEPSSYQYDYTDTLRARPQTSPQPPRTPLAMPSNPTLPVPEPRMDDPFITPSPPPIIPGTNENPAQVPQHTFRSLYEMLNDERSARRRLEQTMRNLQDEIANLHYQVSVNSNVQSQRSSYMPSSSRLQALLAGTEESPPGTTESQQQRWESSGVVGGGRIDGRIVSRFSGSESEAGRTEAGAEGGLETPYEAYQTPAEEQSPGRFAFGTTGNGQQQRYGNGRVEGEMF